MDTKYISSLILFFHISPAITKSLICIDSDVLTLVLNTALVNSSYPV